MSESVCSYTTSSLIANEEFKPRGLPDEAAEHSAVRE